MAARLGVQQGDVGDLFATLQGAIIEVLRADGYSEAARPSNSATPPATASVMPSAVTDGISPAAQTPACPSTRPHDRTLASPSATRLIA